MSFIKTYLAKFYEFEVNINIYMQHRFPHFALLFASLTDFLAPMYILDLWIPLAGVFNHQLLIKLVGSIGLANMLTSVFKWCMPEYRPYWWLKEFNSTYHFPTVKLSPYLCETSAGFPSEHVIAFTIFILIVFYTILASEFLTTPEDDKIGPYMMAHASTVVATAPLCFSHMFFLTEFPHQCLGSSVVSIISVHWLNSSSRKLLNCMRWKWLLFVVLMGFIPVAVYFAKLYLDVDPHWSVRMAFKWCPDAEFLRHETSPVFVLCRDFGFLLGVALSAPLAKHYEKTTCLSRFSIMVLIVVLNWSARDLTPKQQGRFTFVAYEFVRNCLYSYSLLTILPKFHTN